MLEKSMTLSPYPLPTGAKERVRGRERRLNFGNAFIGHQKGKAK
jgi:hypothetical protein